MKLDDQKKADVLLKILEENRKQTEWVKNLDYKIVYYTVLFFLAGIAWLGSKPASAPPKWLFDLAIGVVSLLAIIFLLRNHMRHGGLNQEYFRIVEALLLNKENEYGSQPLYQARRDPDWAFHAGRGIYAILIILSAIVTPRFAYFSTKI